MRIGLAFLLLVIAGCSDEKWFCKTQGQTMYSMSESGEVGSAGKGCSCDEIRAFEQKVFGEVDEEALKTDFGC